MDRFTDWMTATIAAQAIASRTKTLYHLQAIDGAFLIEVERHDADQDGYPRNVFLGPQQTAEYIAAFDRGEALT